MKRVERSRTGTPVPGARERRANLGLLRRGVAVVGLVAGLGSLVLLGGGCGDEPVSRPSESVTNVLVAYYQSPTAFEQGVIDINGERIDREWGSEFTPDRPYMQVRVSSEHGYQAPGASRYLAMKAVYTDTHLYLLVQWTDNQADQLRDVWIYRGPGLGEPIVSCSNVGGETICDTTYRSGAQDSLLLPDWWERAGDDDRMALVFEAPRAAGAAGEFATAGCQVACHVGGAIPFGGPGSGRLDVWYWMAGRTNPVRNIFKLDDDPDDASQGLPGYLDDWYGQSHAGLLPDPGWPAYLPNTDPERDGVPRYVYRLADDPFSDPPDPNACENRFGGQCIGNNGLPMTYLWRELSTGFYRPVTANDTLNETITPDPRKWAPGDLVAGYTMTYPTDSRANVRGKGLFDEDAGVWTVEVARRLDTGDPDHDVIFDPDAGHGYYFTVAIFDGSNAHWGSEPQVLVFGERSPEESR